jgi:hypothetical protein
MERRNSGGDGKRVAMSAEDKTDEQYVEKLRMARENRAAVTDGCATVEQERQVFLERQTKVEYQDLVAYCRVNEKLAPDFYDCFVPDLYKTGWKAAQHQNDVLSERTQEKIEA